MAVLKGRVDIKGRQCSCGNTKNFNVLDVRPTGYNGVVRRRIECLSCGERLTTVEIRADQVDKVVNADERKVRSQELARAIALMAQDIEQLLGDDDR